MAKPRVKLESPGGTRTIMSSARSLTQLVSLLRLISMCRMATAVDEESLFTVEVALTRLTTPFCRVIELAPSDVLTRLSGAPVCPLVTAQRKFCAVRVASTLLVLGSTSDQVRS